MSPPEVAKPSTKRVLLSWSGEGDVFSGGPEGLHARLDGSGETGPSPMDALLLALAGCMAIDVRMIVEKSRVVLTSLQVEAVGERAEDHPRRFEAVHLLYRVGGPSAEDLPKVDRAVQLSRDKYCSVLHSLRPDLELTVEVVLV